MSEFRYYRPNNFPPVVKNLIIINVLVYVAQLTLERQFHLTEKLMLYPIIPEKLRLILSQSEEMAGFGTFNPYQLFTYMFAHSPQTFAHILFNMFALWMFGRILENVWGPKRFLFFYIVCGIGAAAVHLGMQYFRSEQLLQAIQLNDQAGITKSIGALAPALGASGAIMGLLAAFGYLFPNSELFILFIPFPIKAKWAVIGMAAIDLFGGVTNFSGDNVAHFAHLGGALVGFIIVLIWNKTNRKTLY
ncbi:MAG TPA: rhomboid family intramembrane serine protease [Chitinophagaceae bacterium]|jgi:membrane associated rhomboid family serine protease|nr:rhomboid family intramembrane serine protease [Chitinophagaceae bacterium]